MPRLAPRICRCGRTVPAGAACACAKARKAASDKARPGARQRGYGASWETARAAFLAERNRCVSCGGVATVVDHVVPHKGDQATFWNRGNWQPMCAACHGRKTARHDGGFGREVRP